MLRLCVDVRTLSVGCERRERARACRGSGQGEQNKKEQLTPAVAAVRRSPLSHYMYTHTHTLTHTYTHTHTVSLTHPPAKTALAFPHGCWPLRLISSLPSFSFLLSLTPSLSLLLRSLSRSAPSPRPRSALQHLSSPALPPLCLGFHSPCPPLSLLPSIPSSRLQCARGRWMPAPPPSRDARWAHTRWSTSCCG